MDAKREIHLKRQFLPSYLNIFKEFHATCFYDPPGILISIGIVALVILVWHLVYVILNEFIYIMWKNSNGYVT